MLAAILCLLSPTGDVAPVIQAEYVSLPPRDKTTGEPDTEDEQRFLPYGVPHPETYDRWYAGRTRCAALRMTLEVYANEGYGVPEWYGRVRAQYAYELYRRDVYHALYQTYVSDGDNHHFWLKRLRNLLGEEAWRAGRLPPPPERIEGVTPEGGD
jgi:hypothetical protein